MRKKSNNIIVLIIAIILLILGSMIFFFPTISNYLIEQNQVEVIEQYKESVYSTEKINIQKELEKAEIYNENLAGNSVYDPFVKGSGYTLPDNYLEVLNINNNIMGYIVIPEISLKLPIYHGTSNEVLEKGVGHIETSSLPIGGKSRHSVLIGHSGLPTTKLFSDLDKLKIGDYIYINILNKTLTYKIYNTEVIEPTEIEHLRTIKDKDLITLLTCTPYGVNTHRLLVHAERVNNDKEMSYEDLEKIENINPKLETTKILIISIIIIIVITVMVVGIISKRRKK